MKILAALIVLVASITSATAHAQSFLFGSSADQAFGSAYVHRSVRYRQEALTLIRSQWRPLSTDFGRAEPTPLRILIKTDELATPVTQSYVATLSKEKALLMRLYHLSNQDYNRLAAIAFGILGRETKFGTSGKYLIKETFQDDVTVLKALKCTFSGCDVGRNSRGLTQIKLIPASIVKAYRLLNDDRTPRTITPEDLDSPKVAAVATLGFLAESLKILKNRARNRKLDYINQTNLFDYVLYVYFGSMSQLANPHVEDPRCELNAKTATPNCNQYIRTVRHYIRALAFYEFAPKT